MKSTLFTFCVVALLGFSCKKDVIPAPAPSPINNSVTDTTSNNGNSPDSTATVDSTISFALRQYIVAGNAQDTACTTTPYNPALYTMWTSPYVPADLNLQVDGDAQTDVKMHFTFMSAALGSFYSLKKGLIMSPGWQMALSAPGAITPRLFNANDTIGSSVIWSMSAAELTLSEMSYNSGSASGTPPSQYLFNDTLSNVYLGVRYISTSDTTYGWLKIGATSAYNFYLYQTSYVH